MNSLTIIGNLTRDPETRTMKSGDPVCSFTVAVNRPSPSGEQQADFFRVSVWGKQGEACQRYLAKGRKVAVVGPVSVSSYEAKDGSGTRFTLDVRAEKVEFLTPKDTAGSAPAVARPSHVDGFTEIDDDDLPF